MDDIDLFLKAVSDNDFKAVKEIYSRGDVTLNRRDTFNALHRAIENNSEDIALIILRTVPKDVKLLNPEQILDMASSKGMFNLLEEMYYRGEDFSELSLSSFIYGSSNKGLNEIKDGIQKLLSYGVPINEPRKTQDSRGGRTSLHAAASVSSKILEYLIDLGAYVSTDYDDKSPLSVTLEYSKDLSYLENPKILKEFVTGVTPKNEKETKIVKEYLRKYIKSQLEYRSFNDIKNEFKSISKYYTIIEVFDELTLNKEGLLYFPDENLESDYDYQEYFDFLWEKYGDYLQSGKFMIMVMSEHERLEKEYNIKEIENFMISFFDKYVRGNNESVFNRIIKEVKLYFDNFKEGSDLFHR